ncbi:hypothetical protein INR49_005122 [Caranx melampygus]|nr:hypothetical protein INR49_005122 [Caranx melampygus]
MHSEDTEDALSELQEEGINAINLPLSPSHYELDPEDTMLVKVNFKAEPVDGASRSGEEETVQWSCVDLNAFKQERRWEMVSQLWPLAASSAPSLYALT